MSPRSEELIGMGRDRLGAARAALASGFPAAAVSSAYYAMLYAARAALSEEDANAKTHRGTWSRFRELFVTAGRFDEELLTHALRTQRLREGADYDALAVSSEQAVATVGQAERFLTEVAAMLSP